MHLTCPQRLLLNAIQEDAPDDWFSPLTASKMCPTMRMTTVLNVLGRLNTLGILDMHTDFSGDRSVSAYKLSASGYFT